MKEFIKECRDLATFYAHHATPKILHPVTIPLFACTLGPVLGAAHLLSEAKYHRANRRELAKHKDIGAREQSIRDIFGEITLQGNAHSVPPGVEMDFADVRVVDVFPSVKRVSIISPERLHVYSAPTREDCAQQLLGRLAYYTAIGDECPDQERYIAVRKKGELQSTFYTAAQLSAPEQGAGYEPPIIRATYVDQDQRGDYVITPVDEQTAQRLSALGL